MKQIILDIITRWIILAVLATGSVMAQQRDGQLLRFDDNWRFHAGPFSGAELEKLDDSQWRKIDLPHDWSIEDAAATRSPFSRIALSQVNGGFTHQGTAWYRKTFVIPKDDQNMRFLLQFDGVYMNADVYINGKHLGNHPYGYTGFSFDITRYLKVGGKNVVALEVKNEGANSRWYAGSGIYRHVWLKKFGSLHLVHWGTNITTPKINDGSATIRMNTLLINESAEDADVSVITRLFTPEGKAAGRQSTDLNISAGQQKKVSLQLEINTPDRWTLESPVLYTAVTTVERQGSTADSSLTQFGIRSISFDSKNGFLLNGNMTKLRGGCVHHDNGPLGAAAYDRAEERKVELLRASGFNAIRCAHNPPSPALLEACDRLGMLVIDEAFDMWKRGKNPYDYHLYFDDNWQKDLESMIMRDRNHPSVIMWSIGNEIPESDKPLGHATAEMLAGFVKKLDPGRPVTAAVNSPEANKEAFFAALDIAGYNYAEAPSKTGIGKYASDHQGVPERVMFGSESFPLEAFSSWSAVEDNNYVIGDFVWTAFDYIGEASIGWLGYPQNANFYPWNLAFCGDIDICGWKRPQSFYRDVLWKENQLSLFVHSPQPSFKENPGKALWSKWNWHDVLPEWNWKGLEKLPVTVVVYSSFPRAELFLNNVSLGIKNVDRGTKYMALWTVPYQPGELKVKGYNQNKLAGTASLFTAQAAAKIRLDPDHSVIKADNQDLCYVTVEVTDKQGRKNPHSANLIKFEIEGDAKIIGVGNANPVSTESYQRPERKAYKGRCLVILKAGRKAGTVILTAKSAGLKPARIRIILES